MLRVSTSIVCFVIASQTRQIISSLPEDHLGRSMVTQGLSQDQWATLDQINEALTQEYAVRREMLLTRADVTVQSLSWSDKAKVGRGEGVENGSGFITVS